MTVINDLEPVAAFEMLLSSKEQELLQCCAVSKGGKQIDAQSE
jgi:hypothetical protein